MIVEFTGSTGAGKTSILAVVMNRLRERGCQTSTFPNAASAKKHPSLTNLFWDLRLLPSRFRVSPEIPAFLRLSRSILKRNADSPATALNLYRSVLRKTYLFVWTKKRFKPQDLVLLDEGPLHCTHQLFVHQSPAGDPEDVAAFLRMVPKPDLVIYVTAPSESLSKRTSARIDPPRRMGLSGNYDDYVRKAHDVFETIFSKAAKEIPELSVIRVENDGRRPLEELAEDVVSHILARKHAGPSQNPVR